MPIIPIRPDIGDHIEFVDEDQAELHDLAATEEIPSLADQRAVRRYRNGLAADVRGAA